MKKKKIEFCQMNNTYGIVLNSFNSSNLTDPKKNFLKFINVNFGDILLITDEGNDDWYEGIDLTEKNNNGYIPKDFVKILNFDGNDDYLVRIVLYIFIKYSDRSIQNLFENGDRKQYQYYFKKLNEMILNRERYLSGKLTKKKMWIILEELNDSMKWLDTELKLDFLSKPSNLCVSDILEENIQKGSNTIRLIRGVSSIPDNRNISNEIKCIHLKLESLKLESYFSSFSYAFQLMIGIVEKKSNNSFQFSTDLFSSEDYYRTNHSSSQLSGATSSPLSIDGIRTFHRSNSHSNSSKSTKLNEKHFATIDKKFLDSNIVFVNITERMIKNPDDYYIIFLFLIKEQFPHNLTWIVTEHKTKRRVFAGGLLGIDKIISNRLNMKKCEDLEQKDYSVLFHRLKEKFSIGRNIQELFQQQSYQFDNNNTQNGKSPNDDNRLMDCIKLDCQISTTTNNYFKFHQHYPNITRDSCSLFTFSSMKFQSDLLSYSLATLRQLYLTIRLEQLQSSSISIDSNLRFNTSTSERWCIGHISIHNKMNELLPWLCIGANNHGESIQSTCTVVVTDDKIHWNENFLMKLPIDINREDLRETKIKFKFFLLKHSKDEQLKIKRTFITHFLLADCFRLYSQSARKCLPLQLDLFEENVYVENEKKLKTCETSNHQLNHLNETNHDYKPSKKFFEERKSTKFEKKRDMITIGVMSSFPFVEMNISDKLKNLNDFMKYLDSTIVEELSFQLFPILDHFFQQSMNVDNSINFIHFINLIDRIHKLRDEHFTNQLNLYLQIHFSSSTFFRESIEIICKLIEKLHKNNSSIDMQILEKTLKHFETIFKFNVRSCEIFIKKQLLLNIPTKVEISKLLYNSFVILTNNLILILRDNSFGKQSQFKGYILKHLPKVIKILVENMSKKDLENFLVVLEKFIMHISLNTLEVFYLEFISSILNISMIEKNSSKNWSGIYSYFMHALSSILHRYELMDGNDIVRRSSTQQDQSPLYDVVRQFRSNSQLEDQTGSTKLEIRRKVLRLIIEINRIFFSMPDVKSLLKQELDVFVDNFQFLLVFLERSVIPDIMKITFCAILGIVELLIKYELIDNFSYSILTSNRKSNRLFLNQFHNLIKICDKDWNWCFYNYRSIDCYLRFFNSLLHQYYIMNEESYERKGEFMIIDLNLMEHCQLIIDCLIYFIQIDVLQLHEMILWQSYVIQEEYGDLRIESGIILLKMFQSLNGNMRNQLMKKYFDQFLLLAFYPSQSIRFLMFTIFHDMMIFETNDIYCNQSSSHYYSVVPTREKQVSELNKRRYSFHRMLTWNSLEINSKHSRLHFPKFEENFIKSFDLLYLIRSENFVNESNRYNTSMDLYENRFIYQSFKKYFMYRYEFSFKETNDCLISSLKFDKNQKRIIEELEKISLNLPIIDNHQLNMTFYTSIVLFIRKLSLITYHLMMYHETKEYCDDYIDLHLISCHRLLIIYKQFKYYELWAYYLGHLAHLNEHYERLSESGICIHQLQQFLDWTEECNPFHFKQILRRRQKLLAIDHRLNVNKNQIIVNNSCPSIDWDVDNDSIESLGYEVLNSSSECQLKLSLIRRAIPLLENGQLYEMALDLCRTQQIYLETFIYDYATTGELLMKQATLFNSIHKSETRSPQYYRLAFYGNLFPKVIRNQMFIIRLPNTISLHILREQMKSEWPLAEIMNDAPLVPSEYYSANRQRIQIHPVKVLKSSQSTSTTQLTALTTLKNYKIISYQETNEIKKFTFKYRSKNFREKMNEIIDIAKSNNLTLPQNEFSSAWFERQYYTTLIDVPGCIKWIPIVETEVVEISPIKNAIEDLRERLDSLDRMNYESQLNHNHYLQHESSLFGLLNPAVQGGISQYEEIFFNSNYLQLFNDKEKDELKELLSLFRRITIVADQALQIQHAHLKQQQGMTGIKIQEEKIDLMREKLTELKQHLMEKYQILPIGINLEKSDDEWKKENNDQLILSLERQLNRQRPPSNIIQDHPIIIPSKSVHFHPTYSNNIRTSLSRRLLTKKNPVNTKVSGRNNEPVLSWHEAMNNFSGMNSYSSTNISRITIQHPNDKDSHEIYPNSTLSYTHHDVQNLKKSSPISSLSNLFGSLRSEYDRLPCTSDLQRSSRLKQNLKTIKYKARSHSQNLSKRHHPQN
ncbi:hypothetical protein SNEBB_003972 [Seison nebaliae]|nr:hypothetical protein SNEBB_003972 [Seison nebaliae]